jgi:cytochrome c
MAGGLEGNKAFAAVLVAGMAYMVAGFFADVLVHPGELEKTAITIQGAAEAFSGPARVIIPTILPFMAKADPSAGQSTAAQQCGSCHSFNQGGAAMVGPNLYNILNAKVAAAPGYSFSDALKKVGGTWTYEQLNKWLLDPQTFAPGTRMSYPGLRNIQGRADLIAYLRSLSASPAPLPTEAEVAAAQAEQKKEQAAAAAPASEGGGTAAAPPAGPSLDQLLASGSADKGSDFASQACGACHAFTKGGATQVGPDLYGIVGEKVAGVPGYSFSPALKKVGGTWTYAALDSWLANPQHFAPGTTMSYAGIPQPKTRANVILYLRSLADKPMALPTVAAAVTSKAAPAKPASSSAPSTGNGGTETKTTPAMTGAASGSAQKSGQ